MTMKNSTDIGLLQKFILEAIRSPLTKEMRIAKNAKFSKLAEKYIEPKNKLTSLDRLEIYNQQYWYRMLDSLEEDFPALCKIIGKENFRLMATKYIDENPSCTHYLSDLGANLHKFFTFNPNVINYDKNVTHQMCLDVIAVEWAQIHAFDAEEKTPASIDTSNAQELFQTEFHLQPHISVLKLEYEVREFILQLKDSSSKLSYPSAKTDYLAVHRHENQVFFKELTQEAFLMLNKIKEGSSIEGCIEAVLESNERQDLNALALRVQESFASWMRLGWLCN